MIETGTYGELLKAVKDTAPEGERWRYKAQFDLGENGAVVVSIIKIVLPRRPMIMGRVKEPFPSTEAAAEHVRRANEEYDDGGHSEADGDRDRHR